MRLALTAAFLYASVEAFDVVSLTPDNYDEMTEGKTVFLKFFAPWVSLTKAAFARASHDPFQES